MSNKDIVMKYLTKYNQPYCDDCLSKNLKIKPRQQINSICNRLYSENQIFRLKSKCVQCNKERIVSCYFLLRINNYKEAYVKINEVLSRIDFKETIKLIQRIDLKLKQGENPKNLLQAADDVIKSDYIENTNSDIEAYNIMKNLWWKWAKSKYKKYGKYEKVPPITFKLSLIDGNVGVIKELIEQSRKKDKKNVENRVYLVLFALILIEQIIMEYCDRLFAELLQGKFDTEGELRNLLLSKYFKIEYVETVNRKYKKYRPDFTKLRNTIAHGWFMTKDGEVFLYHDLEKAPEILKFQEIVDIHDVIMVKLEMLEIYPVLMYYLAQIEELANNMK